MRNKLKILILIIIVISVLILMIYYPPSKKSDTQLPNPASVYCEEQGYELEIRTNPDGSQYGVCIFPDTSECEEWEYYRGGCKIGENEKV